MLNRPLLISLVLATLGGLATLAALADARRGSAPSTPPVSVVVATRPLAVGQRIIPGDIALRETPAAAVPPDAARTIEEASGRYASLPLVRGEILQRQKLADHSPGSNLASLIPAGRVAVSVAVSDVVSTGGFIAPGDRVDVLGVMTKDAGDAAQVVLRDVTVLAVANTIIGATDSRPSNSGSKASGRDNPRSLDGTVTLAVTVDEARRLVQVDEIGKLRLALRPRVDDARVSQ